MKTSEPYVEMEIQDIACNSTDTISQQEENTSNSLPIGTFVVAIWEEYHWIAEITSVNWESPDFVQIKFTNLMFTNLMLSFTGSNGPRKKMNSLFTRMILFAQLTTPYHFPSESSLPDYQVD